MSHTAAPWLKREMYAGTRRYRIEIYARFEADRGEHPICQIPGGFTNQDEDAALILAAPELLESCKELLSYTDPAMARVVEIRALAAIAKAEGSQS